MYSRDEVKKLRETFWTKFGQFMSLHPSNDGTRINWVNYKTGIKHLTFKMDADRSEVRIAIQWSQPDRGIQKLMEEQFIQYRQIMHDLLGDAWIWDMDAIDEYGKPVSRIYQRLSGKDILDQEDWPDIVDFLKPRLLAMDEFWSYAKYGFDIFK